jgi:hypothetical protein
MKSERLSRRAARRFLSKTPKINRDKQREDGGCNNHRLQPQMPRRPEKRHPVQEPDEERRVVDDASFMSGFESGNRRTIYEYTP